MAVRMTCLVSTRRDTEDVMTWMRTPVALITGGRIILNSITGVRAARDDTAGSRITTGNIAGGIMAGSRLFRAMTTAAMRTADMTAAFRMATGKTARSRRLRPVKGELDTSKGLSVAH